jgi:hypothetical protein
MTCAEALSALSIASLRDMGPDSPIMRHCAECPDCSRVTTMVREHEYDVATTLNGLPPMSDPVALAEQSVVRSGRRKKGRIAVMLTGAALVATIWIASWLTIIPALNGADARSASALQTETIQLSCMSPEQAGDIISPYVRSRGSIYYVPLSGIRAITVRGTAQEIRDWRRVIERFESDPAAACRVPPAAPTGSADADPLSQSVRDGVEGALAGRPAAKPPTKAPGKVPTALKTR